MKVYTKKSGHGHHIVDVFAEGDNGAYFNIARCTTTNVEAVDSMNAMFLGSGGFYETQGEAKQALIDEALHKTYTVMPLPLTLNDLICAECNEGEIILLYPCHTHCTNCGATEGQTKSLNS